MSYISILIETSSLIFNSKEGGMEEKVQYINLHVQYRGKELQ